MTVQNKFLEIDKSEFHMIHLSTLIIERVVPSLATQEIWWRYCIKLHRNFKEVIIYFNQSLSIETTPDSLLCTVHEI